MGDAVKMCKSVMKRGGHGHILYFALEFGQWFKLLANVAESPDDESEEFDGESSKEERRMEKTVFNLETIPVTLHSGSWQLSTDKRWLSCAPHDCTGRGDSFMEEGADLDRYDVGHQLPRAWGCPNQLLLVKQRKESSAPPATQREGVILSQCGREGEEEPSDATGAEECKFDEGYCD